MTSGNLYTNIPAQLPEELFQTLLRRDGLRLERIVSHGHTTPPGAWYDQPQDEWVCLLSGSATLQFDDGESLSLCPGDYLLIPAHRRHRVEQTHSGTDTVWLALHIQPG